MKTSLLALVLLMGSTQAFAKVKITNTSLENLYQEIGKKNFKTSSEITFASSMSEKPFSLNESNSKKLGFDVPLARINNSTPLQYMAVMKFPKRLSQVDDTRFITRVISDAMDIRIHEYNNDGFAGVVNFPLGPTMGLAPSSLECEFDFKTASDSTDVINSKINSLNGKKAHGTWLISAQNCNTMLVYQTQSSSFIYTGEQETTLLVKGIFYVTNSSIAKLNKIPFIPAPEKLFASKIKDQMINFYNSMLK